jgi:hypothetical protein
MDKAASLFVIFVIYRRVFHLTGWKEDGKEL